MHTAKKIKLLTCAIGLCFGLSGCSKDDSVALIGGEKVSKSEFETYLKYKHLMSGDPKRLERALDEYANREALAEAIAQQQTLDVKAVELEVAELKKEILISRYFDKLLTERVGPDTVRNYYDTHAKDYQETKVHVAHILIRAADGISDSERRARMTRAQDAYAKLQKGDDFAKVASEYSEDRVSGPKGGDLGWIKEGSIDPHFSDLAFSLKPGTVSEPFLTKFGYHVIKVMSDPTVVKRSFDAVAGDIRFKLRQEAKEAELKRLTGLVKVEKHLAVLGTIKDTGRAQEKQASK